MYMAFFACSFVLCDAPWLCASLTVTFVMMGIMFLHMFLLSSSLMHVAGACCWLETILVSDSAVQRIAPS